MENYLCIGCSKTYGVLHGMYFFDAIYGTEEDALEIAKNLAYDVIDSYSCIEEIIEDTAEESGMSYEECAAEEIEYYVYRLRDDIDIDKIRNLNWDVESIRDEYS